MASSQRNQISSLQTEIGDNSELQDGTVVELKSVSSNVAIDLSPEERVIHPTDTDKQGWTYIGDISDDGNFIQVLLICCGKMDYNT